MRVCVVSAFILLMAIDHWAASVTKKIGLNITFYLKWLPELTGCVVMKQYDTYSNWLALP